VLRLALAGRLQGTLALAGGEPVVGLGDKLCRQLRTAARAWLRSLPSSAPSPAAELLRRADDGHGHRDLAELVRAFRRDAKRAARAARADSTRRLNAAHRRAEGGQAEILAAWPDYIRRDNRDRLVMDADDRFIQLTRLPDRAELERGCLRRWLRDVTAWQWGTPADAVELTDPAGRYAYVPLDAARLAEDGDLTRGPWISTVPARKIAAEGAAAEMTQRVHIRRRV
jgi:PAS domain-containing protein